MTGPSYSRQKHGQRWQRLTRRSPNWQTWDTASIESVLRATLVEGLGLKPKNAFGPVRVATTGRRVSPPLFESLEILGRERSLRRLDQALMADRDVIDAFWTAQARSVSLLSLWGMG